MAQADLRVSVKITSRRQDGAGFAQRELLVFTSGHWYLTEKVNGDTVQLADGDTLPPPMVKALDKLSEHFTDEGIRAIPKNGHRRLSPEQVGLTREDIGAT